MSAAEGDSTAAGGSAPRIRLILAGAVVLAAAAWTWKDRGRAAPARPEPPGAPLPTRLEPQELSSSEATREAQPIAGAYRRDVERPKPVENLAEAAASRDDAPAEPPPGGPSSRRRDEKKTLPEVFRMPPD